ncbi:acyltransferase family protein [Dermatophilaceae bacterium Soc4.6]
MTQTSQETRAPQGPAPGGPPPGKGIRHDIQALRALAVSAVVLYHLWPTRLPGGYVGVDVFFVVSGFLIASHLLEEIERTGRLRPLRFWARRMKRLVPASALVLLTTTAGIVAFASRDRWAQDLSEVVASAVQLENWRLAHDAVDYLASANGESPTRHFWSLSVEEQFYVGLPLLLLLTHWVGGRVHRARGHLGVSPARGPVITMLTGVGVASLVLSVVQTTTTPSTAYFSTLTRAWEFVAGALLAAIGVSARRHRVLPWVGVGAIVVGCFAYGAGTAFPGYAAALPVAGAALALWSGAGSTLARVGQLAPVALLGSVSYAAYLWHWPLLTLLPEATGRALTTTDKLVVVALTIGIAWVSTRFVEEPIRFGPRLLGGRRPRAVVLWCAAATSVVVVLALGLSHYQAGVDERSLATARSALTSPTGCLGARSMDPALSPCVEAGLDGVLLPDPAAVEKDDDNLPECWGSDGDGKPRVCPLGPATGWTKHLIAIGDSHSNTFIGAYRRIAQERNWRIDLTGTGGCYLTASAQRQPSADLSAACEAWRSAVLEIARTSKVDAVIVTHSRLDHPAIDATGAVTRAATVDGLVAAWRELPDVPIVAVLDNPAMTPGTTACILREGKAAATACAIPRAQALRGIDGQTEAAAQVPRAKVVDLTSFYCTATTCPPVIGHVVVYRDQSHLSATYVASLVPYLERAVASALGW